MKLMKTTEAVGQVLCHDITQIIPRREKGCSFRLPPGWVRGGKALSISSLTAESSQYKFRSAQYTFRLIIIIVGNKILNSISGKRSFRFLFLIQLPRRLLGQDYNVYP